LTASCVSYNSLFHVFSCECTELEKTDDTGGLDIGTDSLPYIAIAIGSL